jgi:hypothetical protein
MKNLNKMATVLIFGRNETHYTTKIFKGTNWHVAYKTKYTSQPHLKSKPSIKKQNKYNHSGVY